MDETHYPKIFIVAAIMVFFGSLARRAKELNAMDVIHTRTLFRMFAIELMLMPAFASVAGMLVIQQQLNWLWVLPVGVAAGIGGFATGTLIFELGKTMITALITSVADKIGKGDDHG